MSSLYIHIPFCLKKCSYCDFASFENCDDGIKHNYKNIIIDEIKSLPCDGFETVFVGGGTPTALPADVLGEIMDEVIKSGVSDDCEITVEANPETITDKYAIELKAMGVNRISMGLQSADNSTLKVIGRVHSYERFLSAYSSIRKAGFDNVNIDIMYGLPKQTIDSFSETIKQVIDLSPEHISAYSLILNENTSMYNDVKGGAFTLPDSADMEEALLLLENRYKRYEVSNYAIKGFECKHNLNYWKCGNYYGIGCGAHGCLTPIQAKELGFIVDDDCYAVRTENTCDLQRYINKEKPIYECICKEESMFETVMLGLRMVDGISLQNFKSRYGVRLEDRIGEYVRLHSDLIYEADGYLRLTKRGMDIQNTVLVELMDYF